MNNKKKENIIKVILIQYDIVVYLYDDIFKANVSLTLYKQQQQQQNGLNLVMERILNILFFN